MNKAKDFLQSLIREHDMPPKPTLDIDMSEFRTMQSLMILVQDEARAIRSLQPAMDLSRDKNAEEMKWSPLEMGAAMQTHGA